MYECLFIQKVNKNMKEKKKHYNSDQEQCSTAVIMVNIVDMVNTMVVMEHLYNIKPMETLELTYIQQQIYGNVVVYVQQEIHRNNVVYVQQETHGNIAVYVE
jgi:hypothetical protein